MNYSILTTSGSRISVPEKTYLKLLHREMWIGFLGRNPYAEKSDWHRWTSNGGDIDYISSQCFLCKLSGVDCNLCEVKWWGNYPNGTPILNCVESRYSIFLMWEYWRLDGITEYDRCFFAQLIGELWELDWIKIVYQHDDTGRITERYIREGDVITNLGHRWDIVEKTVIEESEVPESVVEEVLYGTVETT